MLKSSFIANSTLQAKCTSLLTRTGYIDIADGSLTGLDTVLHDLGVANMFSQ